MMDLASMRARAIVLMREALELLDEAGVHRGDAPARAHDVAMRVPPMQPGDELDFEFGPKPDRI
ncbi:hypothetical protein ACFSHP_19535 [Novosphingobium panipatense]